MTIRLIADRRRSAAAEDCVQRQRGADAEDYRLRLIVDQSGRLSISEQRKNALASASTLLSIDVPYGIDPDRVLAEVVTSPRFPRPF